MPSAACGPGVGAGTAERGPAALGTEGARCAWVGAVGAGLLSSGAWVSAGGGGCVGLGLGLGSSMPMGSIVGSMDSTEVLLDGA